MVGMKKFDIKVGVRYAGFCYDGPHEGQWRESETSVMMMYSQDPLWFRQWNLDKLPEVHLEMHRMYYRWSDPLRAWVCLNMK